MLHVISIAGEFYEALQMYKTISRRYVSRKKTQDALDLLQAGAKCMLEHEQVRVVSSTYNHSVSSTLTFA